MGRIEGAKTFLIDLPVLILFGLLFSLFDQPDKVMFRQRAFWHGVVFSTIFNGAVAYAIFKFPDWMWMYYLEDSTNSASELAYLFLFLYYLPYVLGYLLGRELKRLSKNWVFGTMASMGLSEIWLILKLFDRYSVVGTKSQFLEGTAISLFDPVNPLGPALNGSVVVMVLYFVGFVYLTKRRSKKA